MTKRGLRETLQAQEESMASGRATVPGDAKESISATP